MTEKVEQHTDDVYPVNDINELIILVGQASAALSKARYDHEKAHRTLLRYVEEKTVWLKGHIAELRENNGS